MADDLDAFFAKKKQKSKDRKKKGVVNLEDVGQQLERKAKIQEYGEFDLDEQMVELTAATTDNRSSSNKPQQQNNDEDSEWLEYNAKPSAMDCSLVREYVEEVDEQVEDDTKRSGSAEMNRTWNTVMEKRTSEEPVEHKTPLKAKYQAPGGARRTAPLDITSEEMFPSIENAAQIEKIEKQKAEERKKAPKEEEPLEPKRSPWGGARPGADLQPRQDGAAYTPRTDRYDPPRPQRNDDSFNRPGSGFGNRKPAAAEDGEPSASETDSSWRRSAPVRPPPAQTHNAYQPRMQSAGTPQSSESPARAAADDADNWRRGGPSSPATRPAPVQSPQPPPAASTPGKYVPPSMRGKN